MGQVPAKLDEMLCLRAPVGDQGPAGPTAIARKDTDMYCLVESCSISPSLSVDTSSDQEEACQKVQFIVAQAVVLDAESSPADEPRPGPIVVDQRKLKRVDPQTFEARAYAETYWSVDSGVTGKARPMLPPDCMHHTWCPKADVEAAKVVEQAARRTFATRGHEATWRGQQETRGGRTSTRGGRTQEPASAQRMRRGDGQAAATGHQKHVEAAAADVQDEIKYITRHYPTWQMILDTRSLDAHEYLVRKGIRRLLMDCSPPEGGSDHAVTIADRALDELIVRGCL